MRPDCCRLVDAALIASTGAPREGSNPPYVAAPAEAALADATPNTTPRLPEWSRAPRWLSTSPPTPLRV
jgi:hypothetical protein